MSLVEKVIVELSIINDYTTGVEKTEIHTQY